MNIEEFCAYCLAKPHVEDTFPFGPDTLVFKVMGKMFALTGLENEVFSVTLKCDPEEAIALREAYEEVRPGYHTNKQHWNTVRFEGSLSDEQLCKMIDDSYHLVVASLPKKLRDLFQSNT